MGIIRIRAKKLRQSQEGVVSLLVTMVLMIVVSLIALGFAQVARRNQGQELDQQLSTQAFYAAESGVNDASQIISTALASTTPPTGTELDRTSCIDPGYNSMYLSLNSNNSLNSTDPGSNIEYTCVLVEGDPGAIQTDIGTTSKIIPIDAASDIGSINLAWSSQQNTANSIGGCPRSATLPTNNAFSGCGVGVLRVDLVPIDNNPAMSANSLAEETLTFFAVPTPMGTRRTVGVIQYDGANSSTGNRQDIVPAQCVNSVAPNKCAISIDIPVADQNHEKYEMRVSSEYEDSSLEVTADTPAPATGLPLSGAQVVIDATGRAQNVVRRIQVYVPIGIQSNKLSDYAIESTDSICKRYVVMKGSTPTNGYYASEMGGTGVTANSSGLDPLCQ